MTEPLRVAVVGAGGFGAEHLAAYRRLDDVEVVAVVDRQGDRARELAGRHGVGGVYTAIHEMLAECRPQAVSVVTPARTHPELAVAAVEAGAAVLVEKPIAAGAAGAAVIEELSAMRPVLVGHVLRFAEPYRRIRAALTASELGRPQGLVASRERPRDHAERFPHDDLLDLTMIHDVDVALWLTGDTVRAVSGRATRDRAGRLALAQVQAVTETGAVWAFAASWLGGPGSERDTLRVTGDRAAAGLTADARGCVVETGAERSADGPLGAVHAAALRAELAHFCACARTGTPSAIASVGDAAHALDVVLAARRSIEDAGRWVDVPARKERR